MTKRTLFISQEMTLYAPETEMSLVGRNLPQAIQENDCEIRTFIPKQGNINERRGQLYEVIRLSSMNLIIDDTDHSLLIKAASILQVRIQAYFIDNEDYFTKRQMTVDESGAEYPDNGEHAIFFACGVLETMKKLRWVPDIIHRQGWMGTVTPLYIRAACKDEPSFADAKVISSLFQIQLKTDLETSFKRYVQFKDAKLDLLKPYNKKFDFFKLGKLAIDYSDGIIEAGTDVNEKLLRYYADKGLPFLRYPRSDFTKAYQEFYDLILQK